MNCLEELIVRLANIAVTRRSSADIGRSICCGALAGRGATGDGVGKGGAGRSAAHRFAARPNTLAAAERKRCIEPAPKRFLVPTTADQINLLFVKRDGLHLLHEA